MNDGGPAFPLTEPVTELGMTLRDWFAGMSLIGTRAALGLNSNGHPTVLSKLSYEDADAMLAEREKPND